MKYYNLNLQLGYVESTRYFMIPIGYRDGFESVPEVMKEFREVITAWLTTLEQKKSCCKKMPANARFCSNCGAPIGQLNINPAEFLEKLPGLTYDGSSNMYQFFEENGWYWSGILGKDQPEHCFQEVYVGNVLAYIEEESDYLEWKFPNQDIDYIK